MVESKNKTTVTRAKIAHKLARYYRATSVHLTGVTGPSQPSTAHLSRSFFTQPSAVPPREDSEEVKTPGTLLMTRRSVSLEPATSPDLLTAENLSSPDQLLFCFPASTEAEE
jgi:hypothetical protein